MTKARVYRFGDGSYGVQRRVFFCFWVFCTVPDEIGNEICKTTGMRMTFCTMDYEEAKRRANNLNAEGPLPY